MMDTTVRLVTATGDEKFESFGTNEYLIRSNVFAEMVKLAMADGYLEQHVGDLYADANWLTVYLTDDHREFFFGIRPTGTDISYYEMPVTHYNGRVYRFLVSNNGGRWNLTIEQIKGAS